MSNPALLKSAVAPLQKPGPVSRTHIKVGGKSYRRGDRRKRWYSETGEQLAAEFQAEEYPSKRMKMLHGKVYKMCPKCRTRGKHSMSCRAENADPKQQHLPFSPSAPSSSSSGHIDQGPETSESQPGQGGQSTSGDIWADPEFLEGLAQLPGMQDPTAAGPTANSSSGEAELGTTASSGPQPASAESDDVISPPAPSGGPAPPQAAGSPTTAESLGAHTLEDEEDSPDVEEEDDEIISGDIYDFLDTQNTRLTERREKHCPEEWFLLFLNPWRGPGAAKFSAVSWGCWYGVLHQVSPVEENRKEQIVLKCRCGTELTHHGWSKGFRVVKSLGLSPVEFLKMRQYICKACPAAEGTKSKTYCALSPFIQEQLPEFARRWDLINTERSSVAKRDVIFAREATQRGANYQGLVEAARVSRSEVAVMKEISRITYHQRMWNAPHPAAIPPTKIEGSSVIFRFVGQIGQDRLKSEVREELKGFTPFAESLMKENAKGTKTLGIDMTNPWGNGVASNGCACVMVTTNDYGAPVSIVGCATKSVPECGPMLKKVVERSNPEGQRSVEVIFTDQPHADKPFIARLFGPEMMVLDDMFHVKQDIYDCVAKNSEHRELWEAKVMDCFVTYSEEDLDSEVARCSKDLTDAEKAMVRRKLLDPRAVQRLVREGAVRTSFRPAKDIVRLLSGVIGEFVLKNCFTTSPKSSSKKSTLDVLSDTMERLTNHFDYPPEMVWYVKVPAKGPRGFRYISFRGTSKNENLNGRLWEAGVGRYAPELADGHIKHVAVRRSIDIRRKILGMEYISHVYDLRLINEMLAAVSQLTTPEGQRIGNGFQSLFPQQALLRPLPEDQWVSGLLRIVGSALDKAEALITGEACHSVAGRLKVTPPSPTRVARSSLSREPRFGGVNPKVPSEKEMIFALIAKGECFKKKEDLPVLLCVEKKLSARFWSEVANKTPKEVLHLEKLAIHVNFAILEGRAKNSPVIQGVLVDLDRMTFKECGHLSEFLAKYAAGICYNNAGDMVNLQFEASQVQVEVIAPAQPTFRDATVALTRTQLPRPVQPRSSAPDTSSSGQELSSAGAASPSAPPQGPQESASTSTDSSKERRPRLPCPVCNRAEHPASSDCAFFVWRKGDGKVVARKGKESASDAQRRVWLALQQVESSEAMQEVQ